VKDLSMSPTEIVAILIAVGGFITALATARNSVSQTDIERIKQKAINDAAELKSKADLIIQEQQARDASVDKEFLNLRAENDRLDASLKMRRMEIERFFQVEVELRQAIALRDDQMLGVRKEMLIRDEEMLTLRRDLSSERALNTHLSKRVTDLESRVKELTDERDALIAAMT